MEDDEFNKLLYSPKYIEELKERVKIKNDKLPSRQKLQEIINTIRIDHSKTTGQCVVLCSIVEEKLKLNGISYNTVSHNFHTTINVPADVDEENLIIDPTLSQFI